MKHPRLGAKVVLNVFGKYKLRSNVEYGTGIIKQIDPEGLKNIVLFEDTNHKMELPNAYFDEVFIT